MLLLKKIIKVIEFCFYLTIGYVFYAFGFLVLLVIIYIVLYILSRLFFVPLPH